MRTHRDIFRGNSTPAEAAMRVWALVVGFAGDHALQRHLMVLNAYIDGSGKGDPKFLILAGYIATADAWIEFSREWQSRLDQAGLPYFKMNEMASRPEIAGWFYRVVEEYDIKAAVSCVIHTEELVRVNRSIKYPPYITKTYQIENPYWFGFKAITDVLAQNQKQLKLVEPVDFVFDDESEKVKIPHAWEIMKANSDPAVTQLMGDTPIYRDDKKVMPLQAADLYAWWILKWEREGLMDAVKTLPFPWGAKKEIPRLAMRFQERDFLRETSKGLAKYARTPEELAYAISILPPDLRAEAERSYGI